MDSKFQINERNVEEILHTTEGLCLRMKVLMMFLVAKYKN